MKYNAESSRTLADMRTKCFRCSNPVNIETDEIGVEQLSTSNHRFYHWRCVVKDLHFARTLEHRNLPK